MSDVNELLIAPLQKFSKDSMHLIKKCTKPDRKGKSFFYTEVFMMSRFGSGGELQTRCYPHRHRTCPASLALWRNDLGCFHIAPCVFIDAHPVTRISPFPFSVASAKIPAEGPCMVENCVELVR